MPVGGLRLASTFAAGLQHRSDGTTALSLSHFVEWSSAETTPLCISWLLSWNAARAQLKVFACVPAGPV